MTNVNCIVVGLRRPTTFLFLILSMGAWNACAAQVYVSDADIHIGSIKPCFRLSNTDSFAGYQYGYLKGRRGNWTIGASILFHLPPLSKGGFKLKLDQQNIIGGPGLIGFYKTEPSYGPMLQSGHILTRAGLSYCLQSQKTHNISTYLDAGLSYSKIWKPVENDRKGFASVHLETGLGYKSMFIYAASYLAFTPAVEHSRDRVKGYYRNLELGVSWHPKSNIHSNTDDAR